MNIKELGDIHTAFFTALFNCVKEKPYASRRVGDVFIEFKVIFKKSELKDSHKKKSYW